MTGETAYHWRHPALRDVDLLRARFVTHRFSRHTHEGYTFGLIEAGVEEFEHKGDTVRAGPGAIAVVNPDTVHTGHAGVPEGWTYRAMYPSVPLLGEVAAELGAPSGTPSFPEAVVVDPAGARRLRAAFRAADGGDSLAATSLLRTALAGLVSRHAVRVLAPAGKVAPPAVRAVREILDESLIDPPSLEALALSVGERPLALLRSFRAVTGMPPHTYLNHLRVRHARRLLDDGLPPAEVAARTGFADQAHLTRHFKRAIGVPPRSYQRGRVAPPRGGLIAARA